MLYVCATPIGNLGDVTPRVLDALREAELVAAEDTRRTRKLLSHFDIHSHLTSFFQHNELQKTDEVLRLLRDGSTVALVTDAGMPGVQDPGMLLVQKVVSEGLDMTVLPGPSAVLTALVAAGISGEGFRFVGYLPRRARELESSLAAWQRAGGILIAFDTGQRLARSLAVLAAHLPDARAAVCRELTKVHEEVVRGTLWELSERYPVPGPDAGPTGLGARRDHAGDRPGEADRRGDRASGLGRGRHAHCWRAASRGGTPPPRSTCASACRAARRSA